MNCSMTAPLTYCSMHYSPIDDLQGPVGIVCNDAGGANQVFAMLVGSTRSDVNLYLSGPARQIYEGLQISLPLASDMRELVTTSRTLLTGTGWSSDLEFQALREAKSYGAATVAVLDHWMNYSQRFIRNGEVVRPDEVWVVDKWAQQIALREFPGQNIRLVPDSYSAAIINEVSEPPTPEEAEILFVFEPARSRWGRGTEGEWQAWEHFVQHVGRIDAYEETTIRVRPHPSQAMNLFESLPVEVNRHPVVVDTLPLTESLSRALWVVGLNSSVLPLALAAQRKAYSSLPPWAPGCQLPHDGIRLL